MARSWSKFINLDQFLVVVVVVVVVFVVVVVVVVVVVEAIGVKQQLT